MQFHRAARKPIFEVINKSIKQPVHHKIQTSRTKKSRILAQHKQGAGDSSEYWKYSTQNTSFYCHLHKFKYI